MFEFSSDYMRWEIEGHIGTIWLNRVSKRNAITMGLVEDLGRLYNELKKAGMKALILAAEGDHFCAGLDLSAARDWSPFEGAKLSQDMYEVLDRLEFGDLPIVSSMHGAVIGGGLELVTATHVRVAAKSCFYQLPEGKRGIFVGGGASVRVSRIMGADRMREMMLTGRTIDSEVGQNLGLSHYLVESGTQYEKAMELALLISTNAELSNFMTIKALPRIADMGRAEGLLTESIATAMTLTNPQAVESINRFLNKETK